MGILNRKRRVGEQGAAVTPDDPEYWDKVQHGVGENVNRVPAAQWRKWGDRERKVFNEVYSGLLVNRHLACLPNAPETPWEAWRVIAWNAAWLAAGAADRCGH